MKSSCLLAFTTAALLAAGSAFACPNKPNKAPSPGASEEGVYEVSTHSSADVKCPKRENKEQNNGSTEGVFEVADRDGDKPQAERPQRPERGERGERPGGPRGPEGFFRGLDLSEEQQAKVKEIMEGARKAGMALREEAKKAHESGEEVDRQAIMAKMREIHEGAMKKVYDDVLTEAQQAKVDKMREEMEKRRAERGEGAEGDRPQRPRRGGEGEGDRPERPRRGGGDLDL